MRSALPKALHAVAGRADDRPRARRAARRRRRARSRSSSGPNGDDVAAAARRLAPEAEVFVQRERRGTAHARSGRARGDRARLRRRSRRLRRHAADDRGEPDGAARRRWPTARSWSRWLRGGEPDRLRPADRARRPPRRHPRGEGRDRSRARDSPLQRRPDGDLAARARSPCSTRSAPTTRRRNSTSPTSSRSPPRRGLDARDSARRRGGGDGRQRPRPARRRRSGDAAAAAPQGDARGRDAGRAGDRVPVRRRHDRPRRDDRAACRDRRRA